MKNNKPVLLLVDDEKSIRELMGYALEELDAELIYAENGKGALTAMENEPVDLVLTDLLMPGMTGIEFIKELKKKSCGVPVIIITAYGNMEMAKEIRSDGIFRLIEKPLDFDILVPIIKDALKTRGIEL